MQLAALKYTSTHQAVSALRALRQVTVRQEKLTAEDKQRQEREDVEGKRIKKEKSTLSPLFTTTCEILKAFINREQEMGITCK